MRQYFKHESATGYVDKLDTHLAVVMGVRANFKNQGHGTGLMQEITRWADEEQCILLLHARIYEHHGIPTNEQLERWYMQFGFVRKPEAKRERKMIRWPSSREIPVL